jgi:hypothetical protein
MTEQHPITPPPELVWRWTAQLDDLSYRIVFSEIAQWGADQELNECCGWVAERLPHLPTIDKRLRNERRPKPSSLKLQALNDLNAAYDANKIEVTTYCNIRRALEQLDD